ncbi:DUF4349 domain-containing protein [Lachnospiraceae bacterium]|nr:DUF4349 domain-containing protein [Lachnospiraceae bacterium]
MKKVWGKILGKNVFIGLAAAAVMLQIGCGSASKYDNSTAAAEASATEMAGGSGDVYLAESDYAAEEGVEAAATDGGETVSVASNRKLIKDVYMDVETGDFDKLLATVEGRVDALGGYIENMNVHNGSGAYGNSLKGANLTIRIPKDKLGQFVTEVSECSNVVSRSEKTQDVTMEYVDLESHKKALMTEQERLLELLGRADTMEDIITIEERLSQIRYEMESMESQLRTYDNLVDFSTVTLSIKEVEVLTPTREETAWEKMSKGFVASMNGLGRGLKNTFIWFVISLPYLVFWAAFIVGIIFIIRATRKRKAKKLEKLGWKQQPGAAFDMRGNWSGRQSADVRNEAGMKQDADERKEAGVKQDADERKEAGMKQDVDERKEAGMK